jgi:hypothetical protein
MSLSANYPGLAPANRGIETRALLAIIWLATVVAYLVAVLRGGSALSTDDAMRLVQIREFLAGQGWFDLTQYRLSPPEGVAMHWSRLIDLPLAALIGLGETVVPSALAERLVITVWPVSLLLVFLIGVTRLAQSLAGDTAAKLAVIFAALLAPVLQHFRPGAIDHHNVQLVLLIWTLALAARPDLRAFDAALAGALSALSLAIGLEMAAAIAALATAMALRWIVCGNRIKRPAAAFGLAFAAVVFVLAAATVPPARYAVAACDALSVVHVTAATIGGLGLAVLCGARGLVSPARRLAGAGVLAALLAAILAFAFPACLADPYAQLDPRLAALWLANVNETRSIASLLRDLPQEVLPQYGLAAAALILGTVQYAREPLDRRWTWMTALAVLAALFLVALWQVRGSAAANAVAVALLPAALLRMFPAPSGGPVHLGLGRAALIGALLLNPLALIALGGVGARAVEIATNTQRPTVVSEGPGTCRQPSDYAPLARLPRGLMLGFIDAGPFVLMETPHAVLAAPYHRNVRGNGAMLDAFLAPPDQAAGRLAALGVDYVVFCIGAPERHNYAAAAPDGLAAALGQGDVPGFLERIPLEGTSLAVYRVRP